MRYPHTFLMKKIREALEENRMLKGAANPYKSTFGRKEDAPEEADEDVKKFKKEVSGE